MNIISVEQVQAILEQKLPGAKVSVRDMTGTSDHFEATVAWEEFSGKGLIEQHQMVNKALAEQLKDGRVHALKIKTSIPASS